MPSSPGDDRSSELAPLTAAVDALTARVTGLEKLVDDLRAAPGGGAPAAASTDDELWRRLGLTEGERRTVTVMFADVSGFTALSERLDPEAFQLVIRDTMSVLAACVSKYDGYLEKSIGDALCAIFGAPVSHDDEPRRAARAAIDMHAALEERARMQPDLPPLEVHIGINTGPVIAGTVGDGSQFGVVGDTINTAARLMNLAVNRETFVSAETARRIRRQFRLEDRGLHEVKGKAKPIAASLLVDELSEEERAGARLLRSPMVARDAELASLRNLAALAADGDGATVLLVGDDGVGTTRLAEELGAELAAQGWRFLQASARVYAETTLGLVAAAVQPLLAERSDAESRDLLEVLVTGGVVAPHDFELSLATVVRQASEAAPLVILVDDADDADPGSVEVVRFLSRATAEHRVLWVLTGHRVPLAFDPLVGSPDVIQVSVPPLDDEAIAALFEGLLPGALDATHRARLGHLAEGNAEFAEEIALALVDDGVVVEAGDGSWTLVGDPDAVELPGSVAELIETRIDQLATAARITLQDAAMIGVRFSERLLARVATVPASLDGALAELTAAELVVRPAEGEGGFWMFRSRLVREVAYDSILRRRRPPAHRRVADALLALEPERVADNADLLAHHFEESDDPPLALPYLHQAVERAEFTYNFAGALERARRALRLRDRFPDRVGDAEASWLNLRVGLNRLLTGDRGGLVDLERAVELLTGSATPAEVASLEERVGWYLVVAGDREEGIPHLQQAQSIAESELDGTAREGLLAAVATTRALAVGVDGDLAIGLAAVDGAEQEARAAGDHFTEARALLVGGMLRLWAGRAGDATTHLRQALDLSWQHVFGTIADRCGRFLVLALVDAGRYAEALELASPLLARADDRGDPSVGVGVRAAVADLWRQVGDLDRARELAEQAAAEAGRRQVAPDAVAEAHLVLAQLALDGLTTGDGPPDPAALDAAAAEAERHCADLVAAHEANPWLAWRSLARIALVRGRIAMLRDDLDAAIVCANDARAALGRADARRERAVADRLEGEARARRGEAAGVELVAGALAAAEDIGSAHLVATTAAAMARAAGALDAERAAGAMERAKTALDELHHALQ